MSAFPDWRKYAVPQRRVSTGCIPTGYEMLLRAAGVKGINYSTFQEDFDLDKNLKPDEERKNNFSSIADAVRGKYPHIIFKDKRFDKGIEKLHFIEERIKQKQPVLASIVTEPFFGNKECHIMPIVDATDDELILLWMICNNGSKMILELSKNELVHIHDKYYDKGIDIAYLENQNTVLQETKGTDLS